MKLFILFLSLLISNFVFGQVSSNVTLLDNWNGQNIDTNRAGYKYNEVWGFVRDGKEYAVLGSVNGTHIFEVSVHGKLSEVDFVPGGFQGHVVHRDYHDYGGYLYGVSDQGDSLTSLQIMDLRYLPDSVSVVKHEVADIRTVHNVFIDESNGLMFLCGPVNDRMQVWSLDDPVNPVMVYIEHRFRYVHDVYARNDTTFLNAAEDGLWIYDYSNPTSPINLGSLEFYPDKGYNHSGWLNEKGDKYVFCDETKSMRIKLADVSDMTDIKIISVFGTEWWDDTAPHNIMYKNGIAYVSYYNDGLQIFDLRNPSNPRQIGFYDTYLGDNDKNWRGAWGIYALFPSGKLLVSDRSEGLFVFDYIIPPGENTETGFYPNPIADEGYFYLKKKLNTAYTLTITAANGKIIEVYESVYDALRVNVSSYADGVYFYKYVNTITDKEATGKFVVSKN